MVWYCILICMKVLYRTDSLLPLSANTFHILIVLSHELDASTGRVGQNDKPEIGPCVIVSAVEEYIGSIFHVIIYVSFNLSLAQTRKRSFGLFLIPIQFPIYTKLSNSPFFLKGYIYTLHTSMHAAYLHTHMPKPYLVS